MSSAAPTRPPTRPSPELRVVGTSDGNTGRWFHLTSRSSVKLSTITGRFVCLAHDCISSRRAHDCVHVTIAVAWHRDHPDTAAN